MIESLIKGRLEMNEQEIEQKELDRASQEKIENRKLIATGGTLLLNQSSTSAQNALKMSLIINGAGAIAVLTFIGNITDQTDLVSSLSVCLLYFTKGVLFTAVGTGLVYFSYVFSILHYSKTVSSKGEQFSQVSNWLSQAISYLVIILVVASYIYFYLGIDAASTVFKNIG